MKLVPFIISIFVAQILFAQNSPRILIETGNTIADIMTATQIYRFPAFKEGKVLLKNNEVYESKLNYNLVTGEMDFITPEGDTMALGNDLMLNLDKVVIDSSTFFYNNGYLEVIKNSKIGSLSKKQSYYVVSTDKVGAYNLTFPGSAIGSIFAHTDKQGNQLNYTAKVNITLQVKTQYFFGNEYKNFLSANKKNIDKVFMKKKPVIENYLKEHQVNFNNEDELKQLFEHISSSK